VLGEAVELLERIVDDTLLDAIADGTFGLMRRPAHAGKGLDGVAERAAGYVNPAVDLLEAGADPMSEQASAYRPERTPPIRGERRSSGRTATRPATGWCRCRSPSRWRTTSGRRAPPCSSPRRWAWSRPWWCTPRAMGPHFTFFVVYGSVHHLVDLAKVRVVEREYPLLSAKDVNAAIKRRLRRKLVVLGACIGTDAHTVGIDAILNIKGFRGGEGARVLHGRSGRQPRAQVLVPELVARARPSAPTQCSCRRSSHSATRTCTTPARCPRLPRGYPAASSPCSSSAGRRFDESMAAELGVDRVFTRGTTPGEVASYLVHALLPVPTSEEVDEACRCRIRPGSA
jgi:beta-lysine 5,6-aminomutase beta subunit